MLCVKGSLGLIFNGFMSFLKITKKRKSWFFSNVAYFEIWKIPCAESMSTHKKIEQTGPRYIHKYIYIYLYLYMRTWCAFHIDQLNSSLFLPCALQRSRRLKSQSDSLTKGDFRIMPPSAWQNIHAMFQAGGQENGPNFSKHIGMASTRGWTACRSIPSLSSGETKRLGPRNSPVILGNG